jgi:hypothetical protein
MKPPRARPHRTDRAEHTGPAEGGLWIREELMQLLSLSGTLAGLCITGVALFHTLGRAAAVQTAADDLLAISALLFLGCTYCFFFALRTRRPVLARRLEGLGDVLFLVGLTGMIGSGFVMVYTVW